MSPDLNEDAIISKVEQLVKEREDIGRKLGKKTKEVQSLTEELSATQSELAEKTTLYETAKAGLETTHRTISQANYLNYSLRREVESRDAQLAEYQRREDILKEVVDSSQDPERQETMPLITEDIFEQEDLESLSLPEPKYRFNRRIIRQLGLAAVIVSGALLSAYGTHLIFESSRNKPVQEETIRLIQTQDQLDLYETELRNVITFGIEDGANKSDLVGRIDNLRKTYQLDSEKLRGQYDQAHQTTESIIATIHK